MTGTPNGTAGVAVPRAAGTIAPVIVADLAVSGGVGRMLLFDLDGAKAAAAISASSGERRYVGVDHHPDQLLKPYLRRPAEVTLDFSRVNRITAIMAGAVKCANLIPDDETATIVTIVLADPSGYGRVDD